MEPLKEMFNLDYFRQLATTMQQLEKSFDKSKFVKEAAKGLEKLSLNQRLRRATVLLHQFLPGDYRKSVALMKDASPLLKKGYTALVFPDFVGQYGKHDLKFSLDALKYFTPFGSSEFAIREYLKNDLHPTLKEMLKWTEAEDAHVRRLASEGSRPRLPWSFQLTEILAKPELTAPILESLKTDDSPYVKKSVANHLNDISKDHPEYLLRKVEQWDLSNASSRWIVKHACRTLIKKGDSRALALFDVQDDAELVLANLTLQPEKIQLGSSVQFSFIVGNRDVRPHRIVVDYAIRYPRLSGKNSRKVFKLKELMLEPLQSRELTKKQVIRDFSTRKHHPGVHVIEILVNGRKVDETSFTLLNS